MKNKLRNCVAILIAYVLLCVVVAWSAYDARITLDRLEVQNCAVAELSVLAEVGLLRVFGEQVGVNREMRDVLLDAFTEFDQMIREVCPEVDVIEGPPP